MGSTKPEVEIRWRIDTPGASVRILRDGEGVAVVPGGSAWWIDTGARPGERVWTVMAEYQGCLSPPARCSLEVSEIRLLLRVDDFQLTNDGGGVETLVRADLAPDVDMRGFSLGVAHEAPLVLLAADAAGTFSAEAESLEIHIVDGGAVATVDFGEDPSKWIEGSSLAVLRLVYAVPAEPGVFPEGSTIGKRKIELRDGLGAPAVPVRLLGPTGQWDPAARASGVATILIAETGTKFSRGDANADGIRNITDGIFILNFLFLGGPEPPCRESANTNGDGALNITDGIYILNFLFLGGPAPPAPYPACGRLATESDCASFAPCER
jgi:hypothetical protein